MSQLALTERGSGKGRDGRSLTGAQKSLVFLMSLEESVATSILTRFAPDEINSLRRATQSLSEIDPVLIAEVHREFTERVERGVPTSLRGSGAYLRRLAGKVLGEGRVAEIWHETQRNEDDPLAKLSGLDVGMLLGMLDEEKPQTAALLLSQFDPGLASDVLKRMPTERQAEIVLRISRLGAVPESLLQDLKEHFASELDSIVDEKRQHIEGPEAAARLIRRLAPAETEALLESLTALDEPSVEEIRKRLFTFEDLLRIDDRGIQLLLRDVAMEKLVVALKTASDDLKEKILGNVSSRVAAMIREEIETLGPVRVSDVEDAQREICALAQALSNAGRLTIAREGGGDFV